MNSLVLALTSAVLIGLGATLTFDLWGLFLKRFLKIAPSNICLVGRWLCYMPQGVFKHAAIGSTPPKPAGCAVSRDANYLIGLTFADAFVALADSGWLQHPTPLPAIVFGIVTVVAAFFLMQPLFGLGFAASKEPQPTLARLRTLINHAVFAVSLYLFALFVAWLLQMNA